MIYVTFRTDGSFLIRDGGTVFLIKKDDNSKIRIEENARMKRFLIIKKNKEEKEFILFSAPLDQVIYTNVRCQE